MVITTEYCRSFHWRYYWFKRILSTFWLHIVSESRPLFRIPDVSYSPTSGSFFFIFRLIKYVKVWLSSATKWFFEEQKGFCTIAAISVKEKEFVFCEQSQISSDAFPSLDVNKNYNIDIWMYKSELVLCILLPLLLLAYARVSVRVEL